MKWIPCWSDSTFRAFWNPFTEACEELKYHQVNVTLFCDNPTSSRGLRTRIPLASISYRDWGVFWFMCFEDRFGCWLITNKAPHILPSQFWTWASRGFASFHSSPWNSATTWTHQAGLMESEGPPKGPSSGPRQSRFRPDSSQLREPAKISHTAYPTHSSWHAWVDTLRPTGLPSWLMSNKSETFEFGDHCLRGNR